MRLVFKTPAALLDDAMYGQGGPRIIPSAADGLHLRQMAQLSEDRWTDLLDNLNREPIISIAQVDVPTGVTLKWYQSQTVKGSAFVNPRYFAKQNRITMVSLLSFL